ncbi:MAG: aspartate aminotransferase family protein [Elusimicrobia bacterium]|nr:aspartate aminotransferase family protein [Elusimicrobiota bacterium]
MRSLQKVPGKKSKRIFAEEQNYISPGFQGIALYSQIALSKGRNAVLTDEDGNRYIDFVSGIGVGSIGHCHPHYVRALQSQVQNLTYSSFTTAVRKNFLRLLASLLPKPLDRVQLFSGGAEAVEAAFRLAKSVTKKFEFVGFWGGFHGKTGGVLGLLGDEFKKDLGPFMPGLTLAPFAYCYRCPLKLKYPECGIACAEHLRKVIKLQTQQQIAAIIAEPVQGTAGNVVPPPEFLPAVQSIAKEFQALFISDEMQTGFGRTGKMWGFEWDHLQPDILTVGKGIGGGFPLSGVVSSKKNCQAKPFSNPSGSSSSYGGNPLAAAAGLATLEVLQKENLIHRSQELGEKLLRRLKTFEEKFEFVGEARGRGLMLGIELVKDKKTKEPLDKKDCLKIFQECLKRGLLSMTYTYSIRLIPPLTIPEKTALEAVDILEEVFSLVSRQQKVH